MKITSRKITAPPQPANEAAWQGCQKALELKDKGDYRGAQEALHRFWKRIGDRPDTTGLQPDMAAEVLLCVGILSCWIGGTDQNKEAHETAKNLITESITYFESVGDIKKVTTARTELAFCYWYEGGLNEARTMFAEALEKLTVLGNTRARALFGSALVEWSASRYKDALTILKDNAHLFARINSNAHKAAYHNLIAMILRELAKTENKHDYLRKAISEYEQADRILKLVHNLSFRANVKNNVGNVLRQLRRFKEAYMYLDEARRLAVSARDRVLVAQFDDSRALALIAEKRYEEAEPFARGAVLTLTKTDRKCLLADALITHGIALARLKRTEQAQFALQRAIEVACEVDALNKAGMAALTLIEEVADLSRQDFQAAFIKARRWLADSQSKDILVRVNKAAEKVVLALGGELSDEAATEILLTTQIELQEEVLKYERSLIRQALAKVNGSVTYAASLLGLSHQGLAYVIQSRHKELLTERSPIRRRAKRPNK